MKRFALFSTACALAFSGLVALQSPVYAGAAVGANAPDFYLEDLDSVYHRLSDLKGKTIFLNFFATWCGPCRAEAPYLKAMYEEYGPQGVEFFMISSSERTSSASQWVSLVEGWRTQYSVAFPILLDMQGVAYNGYGEGYIPHNVVIDRNGKVTFSQSGFNESAIRRKINESQAITFEPPAVEGFRVSKSNGGQVRLDWTKPSTSGTYTHYVVKWGYDASSMTNEHRVDDPNAANTFIDISDSKPLLFAIETRNAAGTAGPLSAPVKFAFNAFCELRLPGSVIKPNSTLILNYRMANYATDWRELTTYMALELYGQFYFYTESGEFVSWPSGSYRSLGPDADQIGNFFSLRFGGDPLPEVNGTFWFALLDAHNSFLYDIDSKSFTLTN